MAAASAVVAATVQEVVMNGNDVSTIISNIDSLYTNALNQIIALTIGLLALGGVVFPLIVAHFQKRKSNADHRRLTAQIAGEINAAKNELVLGLEKELEKVREKFEQRISEIQEDIELQITKIQAGANAKTHHHIAVTSIQNKNFVDALVQCEIAIRDYVIAGDEYNMQITVNGNLLNPIFQNLKKRDFDENDRLEKSISQIVSSIETINDNGRYIDMINNIKKSRKAALGRIS